MAIRNLSETVNQSNADVLARSSILTSNLYCGGRRRDTTLHNVLNGIAVPAVATCAEETLSEEIKSRKETSGSKPSCSVLK